MKNPRYSVNAGFSLLELVMVILIIIILITLLVPVFNGVKDRAEKVNCMANLKSLHVATQSYIRDNRMWPRITYVAKQANQYARDWQAALKPYGIEKKSWICPTIQRQSGNPDYLEDANTRTDYLATPFDSNEATPFRWSKQPWFIERGAVHGSGNLVIFASGTISEVNNLGTVTN